ncbi:MAG TPA: AAA family ATPase [Candidatus Nanoarchaeia archaeon]|nr:AAA family ATPase [Candidatus Nanoarchaeia archaeon]
MKRVILIGGAPTTGKSTIAKLLSKKLGVPCISTDDVREQMREKTDSEKNPALFKAVQYSAEEFLNKFSPQEIVDIEREEGEVVWTEIKKIVDRSEEGGESIVVEGVAVLPHLVARDFPAVEYVRPIFLVDHDVDRIRKVIFSRGLWDDAHTYSDDVKEKEVKWAALFNSWLESEAKKFGFQTVEVTKSENDGERVLKILNL